MNRTTNGEPINKVILNLGIRSSLMTLAVFIPLYLMTNNIPTLKMLPIICIIPPLVYSFYTIKLKRAEKEFFGILRKQNYRCYDCRVSITEMSDNSWILNNKVFCLRCGEKHDH